MKTMMKQLNKWVMLLAVACSAMTAGCKDDEENYLVRETDTIQFSSNLASSQRITLRCNGAWKTVIPDDAQWLSTTPSEGVGTGEFEWITVSATHNRSAERTATIYLECAGEQYPITVTQADGKIIYGTPTVEGNLIEQEASSARICFTYSNAYGDETVTAKCTLGGDCAGLSVDDASFELTNGGATLALDIKGTPTQPGYATFAVSVDGEPIGEVRAKVYSTDEMPVEGLPVTWEFCHGKGTADDKAELQKRQPDWTTDKHTLYADTGSGTITLVEAVGKTTAAFSTWGYNEGHAYVRGLYVDDYWLLTVPVKYLTAGKTINCTGSIGGSGSSAGFFLIEYSADGETWYPAAGAKTERFNDTDVTYHIRARDSYEYKGDDTGYFSYDFPVEVDVLSGTLYVRYRVCANVRVTVNNTITTGGGGSTRLKGTFSISVIE